MTRLFSFFLIVLLSSNAVASNSQSNTLLVLGDSLSAGYQMAIEDSWPSLLPNELQKQASLTNNQPVTVINGSISGDTTGNGLARLPELLNQHKPNWVIIELGANDGLRGFPPQLIKKNLTSLIQMSKDAGAHIALMQIQVPPNYGKRYSKAFYEIYPAIAEEQSVPLLPFFLEYVIQQPSWMMNDGLHPKPIAQPWIARFVAQELVNIPDFTGLAQ
ncbi:arylesterase [Vibrio sp. 03-59-1]|uniref:arylesterase n=1 Tax=Vibrio sp. 03-59-1 TaxID=2607607 RepID=UPI001493983A|nr:arylesterase [Vibrio sp. 03-59-1]NOH83741.1 arylesterase [Vibrio sp. 03-59-1]